MTEINFLESDEPVAKKAVDDAQVDNFVAFLENEGFVSAHSEDFLKAQKVSPEAQLLEQVIGPWEFQYGFHINDYVFSFWPRAGGPTLSEKIEKKSNPIILAIIKVLQEVIPDTMPVNIFKPSEYVDVKVFTVKIIGAKESFNFDRKNIEDLFGRIAQEAIKAFK